MKQFNLITIILFLFSGNSYAQENINMDKFISDLNRAIKYKNKGVTVKKAPNAAISNQAWVEAITKTPQDFAIVAIDAKGNPVEMFGASTPYETTNGAISVPGYALPRGGSYKLVGAAGWAKTASEIAEKKSTAPIPSSSIKKAVGTIARATDYIAQELCTKRSRPTKLTLNINAGFELVFNTSTGSEVEWDLEVVCRRYKRN